MSTSRRVPRPVVCFRADRAVLALGARFPRGMSPAGARWASELRRALRRSAEILVSENDDDLGDDDLRHRLRDRLPELGLCVGITELPAADLGLLLRDPRVDEGLATVAHGVLRSRDPGLRPERAPLRGIAAATRPRR